MEKNCGAGKEGLSRGGFFNAIFRLMGKMRRKADLPEKPCAACGRPFAWRKKWKANWESVRYCSDRCRASGAKAKPGQAPQP